MSYTLGRRTVKAFCQSCGWTLESANAQGVGSQHARRLGHVVCVEVYQTIYYGEKAAPKRAQGRLI